MVVPTESMLRRNNPVSDGQFEPRLRDRTGRQGSSGWRRVR